MLKKLVPIVILSLGAKLTGTMAPDVVEKVTNLVKFSAQRYELESQASRISADAQTEKPIPDPSEPQSYHLWLRANVQALGREPTVDLWAHELELNAASPTTWALVSLGPNGKPDECAPGKLFTETADDVCVEMAVPPAHQILH